MLDGQACASTIVDAWKCGASTIFNEVIDQSTGSIALEVTVSTTAILAVAVSRDMIDNPARFYDLGVNKAVPEPSTWALLATGFLGLADLRLRKRRLAA